MVFGKNVCRHKGAQVACTCSSKERRSTLSTLLNMVETLIKTYVHVVGKKNTEVCQNTLWYDGLNAVNNSLDHTALHDYD